MSNDTKTIRPVGIYPVKGTDLMRVMWHSSRRIGNYSRAALVSADLAADLKVGTKATITLDASRTIVAVA